MVTLVLFHPGLVVFVFRADGHGLRGAGFSAAGVACASKHPRRRAALRHADQRLAHDGHVLGLVAQVHGRIGRNRVHFAGHGIARGHHQPGLVLNAVVDQRCRGMRQLQHGETVVALANAQRDGFAGKPFLLLGPLEVTALPGLVGQHAAHLAVDVNASDLPKAQRGHEVVHGFNAHFVGQRVKVHVARFGNGAVHVHNAAALARRTAKPATAK